MASPALARALAADSSASRPDSLPRLPGFTIVRVPAGGDPLEARDSSARRPAAARPAKDGASAPGQRIFLFAGLGFPLAPSSFTRQWDPGGAFGAGMDLLLEPRFGVRLRGEWAQLPFDGRRFLKQVNRYGTGAIVEGGAASVVLVAALLRFQTRATWPGFAIEGGPGAGMFRSADALFYDPVTAQLFENPGDQRYGGGASAGVGVQFLRRDGSGLFADLHWSALYTGGRPVQYIPFAVGVIFP